MGQTNQHKSDEGEHDPAATLKTEDITLSDDKMGGVKYTDTLDFDSMCGKPASELRTSEIVGTAVGVAVDVLLPSKKSVWSILSFLWW